jgi:hypothetical protein
MKYLIIERLHNGAIRVQDSITDISVTYCGYTERQAIRKHRDNMNIRYKHFVKLYL